MKARRPLFQVWQITWSNEFFLIPNIYFFVRRRTSNESDKDLISWEKRWTFRASEQWLTRAWHATKVRTKGPCFCSAWKPWFNIELDRYLWGSSYLVDSASSDLSRKRLNVDGRKKVRDTFGLLLLWEGGDRVKNWDSNWFLTWKIIKANKNNLEPSHIDGCHLYFVPTWDVKTELDCEEWCVRWDSQAIGLSWTKMKTSQIVDLN